MAVDVPQKHVLAGKRIIIAGAGIAGMAFARAFDQNWPTQHPKPEIVIYERSSREQDRSRDGYTMGIRVESGLPALHSIGLLEKAVRSSTTSSSGQRQQLPTFWAKDWRPLLEPRVDMSTPKDLPSYVSGDIRLVRHVLRELLLQGLPTEAKVHWDNGCEGARILDDGKVQVSLSDGTTDTCDLLVAADGANSKVRSAILPAETLDFAGAVCYIGTSRFPSGKPKLFQEQWGINISGQGIPFLTFPVDSHSGVWALSYRSDKPVRRIRGEEAIRRKDELLDEVRQRGHMFHEPFNEFISATDPVTLSVFNAMHKYPLKHSSVLPGSNIIFIGDANHPMSPFSGNGANMALSDAIELAKQLASNGASVNAAIDAFDADSIPRSSSAIDKSWWVIRILHSKGLVYMIVRAFAAVLNLFIGKKR